MKLFLIATLTAILCARWTMGVTNNNYCNQSPAPEIKLIKFQVWKCGGPTSAGLIIKISDNKYPVCVKGDFTIGRDESGLFSIIYGADMAGSIMGFIPYRKKIDLCTGGACSISATCGELKKLLGDNRQSAGPCKLSSGDVSFSVNTVLDGPVNIPTSVISALKSPTVVVQIDVKTASSLGIKLACIEETMGVDLKTKK